MTTTFKTPRGAFVTVTAAATKITAKVEANGKVFEFFPGGVSHTAALGYHFACGQAVIQIPADKADEIKAIFAEHRKAAEAAARAYYRSEEGKAEKFHAAMHSRMYSRHSDC